MRIDIHNIGLIRQAEIELDGITVLTGANNSGKSSVGKVLFALYHGIHSYKQQIEPAAIAYLADDFCRILRITNTIPEETQTSILGKPSNEIIARNYGIEGIRQFLQQSAIESSENQLLRREIDKLKKKLQEVASPEFRKFVQDNTVEQVFQQEFVNQVVNVFADKQGSICIHGSEADAAEYRVAFSEQGIIAFESSELTDAMDFADVSFVDTPLIINELNRRAVHMDLGPVSHKDDLLQKLMVKNPTTSIIDDALQKHKQKLLEEKISQVLSGKLGYERGFYYEAQGHRFDISMLASGMKSYVVLQLLMDHGYLRPGTLLIIDEPEVHLHPVWQLYFAELIFLFVRELDMKVVLATHSPYFLQAVEFYSKKYHLQKQTHFYLAERQEAGAVFKNIDTSLDETYKLMAQPILDLREMQDELEE